MPYNPTFLTEVRSGNVKEISSSGNTIKGEFKKEVTYKGDTATRFETEIPTFANDQQLSSLLETQNVVINAEPPGERSLLQTLLFSFGPTILLVRLFVLFARRAAGAAGGGGVLGQFGRSRARRVESATQDVSFNDVAGIEEAEQELAEVVDFLKNPDKYRRLGRAHPARRAARRRARNRQDAAGAGRGRRGRRAVLLGLRVRVHRGDRGHRRLARARPLPAGQGRRAGDHLHRRARRDRPLARRRRRRVGGHDEREQTLNQILTEMDGFDSDANVIVLGATNRPGGARPGAAAARALRPARVRPGARRDRPRAASCACTRARCRSTTTWTSTRLASSTPGMVGADLANLVNEAALLAARRGHEQGAARGLHRRAREDRPRRRAQGADRRGGPPPDRLPRGRPRDRRHAHAGRRPGAQGVDHPARAGARRDAVHARGRPLQLLRGRAAREDPRLAAAGGRPRSSSSASPPRAPSPTSSRSRASRAGWWSAGG